MFFPTIVLAPNFNEAGAKETKPVDPAPKNHPEYDQLINLLATKVFIKLSESLKTIDSPIEINSKKYLLQSKKFINDNLDYSINQKYEDLDNKTYAVGFDVSKRVNYYMPIFPSIQKLNSLKIANNDISIIDLLTKKITFDVIIESKYAIDNFYLD